MVRKYRSRTDIVYALLQAAEKEATRTRMMYGAYMSYAQMREYLDLMMDRGLLNYDESRRLYTLTERGLYLLHLIDRLDRLMGTSVEEEEMKEKRQISTPSP